MNSMIRKAELFCMSHCGHFTDNLVEFLQFYTYGANEVMTDIALQLATMCSGSCLQIHKLLLHYLLDNFLFSVVLTYF